LRHACSNIVFELCAMAGGISACYDVFSVR
jgi:hypothetical protein